MTIDRRDFIKGTMAAGVGLGLAALAHDAEARFLWFGEHHRSQRDFRKADFCFVHLTDQHVYDKRHGYDGYRACIKSIRELKEKPDFVVMGGDMVFDGCYNKKDDYLRWLKDTKEITDELGIPWYPCMGNHDPFGLSNARKCDADDPDIGKQLILDMYNWPHPYYSFDYQGWHFAILDSTFRIETEKGPSQIGKIGEEQLRWLAYDLGAAGDRPKICVTHVAAIYLEDQAEGNKEAKAVSPNMVLEDNKELRLVLERHNVTALLQGHCHHIEEAAYKDVRYITSAGGSGAWWAGDWVGSPPGYTLFFCRGGLLTWEHRTFPWTPLLEEKDSLERERQAKYDAEREKQEYLATLEREGISE